MTNQDMEEQHESVAGRRRPILRLTAHPMPARRYLSAALVFLSTCGAGTAPVAPLPETPPRGNLLIVGGGAEPPGLMPRFVQLAGGRGRARIAVLPMASTAASDRGSEMASRLQTLGAQAQVFDLSRQEAETETTARQLDDFTGYWFSGGDQSKLAAVLLATPSLATIHRRYQEGAVVGGTSAGAAVMSNSMLTGNRQGDGPPEDDGKFPPIARRSFEVAEGLGFLPGTIVDQHFQRRARQNRLLSVVLEQPELVGVGIDESTAVLVRPDGRWEVLGESSVQVFDARRARITAPDAPVLGSTDITMHLLPPRSVYDPLSGQTTLPAG
ncbi:MAG: cyanophycinase [Rhodocyclaceae bacterium]|nr:cyanophycinase [Rhodocyclaceae bacterium]